MKIMISGGGTGGHIFPALAIGTALEKSSEVARVVYVGTPYGMEKNLIPKAGKTLYFLPMRGWLGKGLTAKLAFAWRLPASMLKSLWLLFKTRPKAVIGVGGYASAPLLWTAALLGKPTMIQEQNAFPGLVNRISSRFVKLACIGFAEAAGRLACPTITTGNPVREGFAATKPWRVDRRCILILGGSQGAAALNRDLPALLKAHLPSDQNLAVVHQCGRHHLEAVRNAYAGAAFPVQVTPFIDNMSQMMEDVLFAVTRAGASTIAELRLTRIPAVLVPFPKAAHDHQTFNAESLVKLGAALHIPETSLQDSGAVIGELARNPAKLTAMANAYPAQTHNAAGMCAQVALALAQKKEVTQIVQAHDPIS